MAPQVRFAGALIVGCCVWATSASAQAGIDPDGRDLITTPTYRSEGARLMLTVFHDNRVPLDRQAVVKLLNKNTQTILWQTTTDKSEVAFGDLVVGQYDIEVSAFGYLTAHKDFKVQSLINGYHEEITLAPDPSSMELSAPSAGQMPPKARKDTLRGVASLKSGDLKQAQKHLDAAYKLVPNSGDLNFLLGYLSFQKKDFDHTQTYLGSAVGLDPKNVQALTLLGRLHLQRGEDEKARTVLEQAVAANGDYWMAHNLLGDVYLRQQEFEKARQQAEVAIEKGKGGGTPALLVLGQALANLGHRQEGVQALKNFLQDMPGTPIAPQVQKLISEIENRAPSEKKPEPAPTPASVLPGVDPALAATEPSLSMKTWGPPGVDDDKPPVAAGVTCPSAHVIDMAGESVKQLVDDVSKFTAIEELLHENIDVQGNIVSKQTRKFNYIVSISESEPGLIGVDEFRAERSDLGDFPDQIASRGFPALALVFHPDMRSDFQLTCEGLGDWHGQATWLVYFRQRDDRPSRLHDYKIGGRIYPIGLKGRAWIAADKFQIVRMVSELVAPAPKIQLRTEHQIVQYGPVLFPKKNVELWLPKSADLYLDFQKHRYHRRHSFDHFMLFATEADEKRKEPVVQNQPQNPPGNDSQITKTK
jgi:tetratricopeptide (TPR) repeat protein